MAKTQKPKGAKGDAPRKMRSIINMSIGTITFPFPTLGQQTLHLERVATALHERAKFHGFNARCSESMALSAEKFGGRVPESARFAALTEMIGHLESGTDKWDMERERGARVSKWLVLVHRALCEKYPKKSADEHTAWLSDKTDAQLEDLATNSRLKDLVAKYQAEKLKDVNSDAMLDEFNDLEAEEAEETEE